MWKILVSGSVAYDYIMKFDGKFSEHILKDKLENLSVGFTISNLEKSNGGTAHNIAYNLGLLGFRDDTIMLACVGKDFMEEENLQKAIDYSFLSKDEKIFTACAYILTDKENNQITSFYPGAMMNSVNQHVYNLNEKIDYAMISPNAKDAMLSQLKECKEKWIKCFFDPGQAMTLFDKNELIDSLDNANYLICNDYEFWMILDKTWLSQGEVLWMLDKAIITLWKDGVKLLDKNNEKNILGLDVKNVIDPTWAGDSFRSWLLAGLFVNLSREDAARIWNVVASFVIWSYGTLNHNFDKNDIKNKIFEVYGEKIDF